MNGPHGFWCRYCGRYQTIRNPKETKAMHSHMAKHVESGHTPTPLEGNKLIPPRNPDQEV